MNHSINVNLSEYPITDTALRWLEAVFAERFGHSWHLIRSTEGLRLLLDGANGAIVFDNIENCFSQAHSNLPCTRWNSLIDGMPPPTQRTLVAPGVVELPKQLIESRGDTHIIHYDIPGLTYWMLARVEEIGRTDLDEHERFPATASHAFKYGYLDRPVVDEWLQVLGVVIKRQWPGLMLKKHEARTVVSCDVDSPFVTGIGWRQFVRRLGGDILKRHSPRRAIRTLTGELFSTLGNYRFDAHRMGIDLIMKTNERVGRSVAFNFIPDRTDIALDNQQSLKDPRISKLVCEIHQRGHEIGVHPGYNTYSSPEIMARSVQTLREYLKDVGIFQPQLGGRQHYLRWETPTTARLWDDNGLDYDSTLCYADHPGFRCGTCFEYSMFDAVKQDALRLRQRPLIVMECSVIADSYMGLGYSEAALELMQSYKRSCYMVGGQFGLLWHNSHFDFEADERFYKELIS